jgi:Zn-dependent membrane protease YugP
MSPEIIVGVLWVVFGLAFVGLTVLDRMKKVYARPRPDLPLSPQQLARQLLERGGLGDITVAAIPFIPDNSWSVCYDEEERLFALSQTTADARSVTAYARVAEETSRALRAGAEKVRSPVFHRVRRAMPWLWIERIGTGLLFVWVLASSVGLRPLPPLWVLSFLFGICAVGGALLLRAMRRACGGAPTDPLPMLATYLAPADLRSARRVLIAEWVNRLLLVLMAACSIMILAATYWSESMQGSPP